jgi:hypothetical protein
MKFEEYYNGLDTEGKNKIEIQLRALSNCCVTHETMVENLYAETSLDVADWDEFISALLHEEVISEKLAIVIRDFCRNDRSLIGGNAKIGADTIIGHVMSANRFAELLLKLRYYNDIDEAKAGIRHIIGLDPKTMINRWKEQDLGRFIMWGTFNPSGGEPFGDPIPIASEIVCSLGLEPISSPLLLFVYILPTNLEAKIPTFCDAYAGDFVPRYFQRVPEGSPYGMTVPTEFCPIVEGKPEVVHAVIKAKELVYPLRYA